MNKIRNFFRRNFHSVMLSIIFLSMAGSLTMLGFQSAQLQRQLEATNKIAAQIKDDNQNQHNHQDAKNECLFNLFVSFVNNRTEITSASVNECKVSVNGVPVSHAEPVETAPQTVSKAPQGTPTPQPVTSTPRTSPSTTAPPTPQPSSNTSPSQAPARAPITIQPPLLPIELKVN